MTLETDVRDAIMRGTQFLAGSQLPSGEFPVLASTDPAMETGCAPDPSIFPTALIAQALIGVAAAEAMRARAADFLASEMDADGLWRHWIRAHPLHRQLPPDLDDSSCASSVLHSAGRPFPDARDLLLANRTRDGLFYTWVAPRPAWAGLAHARVALRQLRHPLTLLLFFRRTSAKPGDVDAVVNANCLFALGDHPGSGKVIDHLLSILRAGSERDCDKWYDDPFVIWYFLSRALAGRSAEAGTIIVERLSHAVPSNALEAAMALCSQLRWGVRPPDDAVGALIHRQHRSGAWPRAALYHGGRPRRRDGSFAPPHPDTPRWGSEALTTTFAVEALSLWLVRRTPTKPVLA